MAVTSTGGNSFSCVGWGGITEVTLLTWGLKDKRFPTWKIGKCLFKGEEAQCSVQCLRELMIPGSGLYMWDDQECSLYLFNRLFTFISSSVTINLKGGSIFLILLITKLRFRQIRELFRRYTACQRLDWISSPNLGDTSTMAIAPLPSLRSQREPDHRETYKLL